MKYFQFLGLVLLALSFTPRTTQAWLMSQTRREMMGVAWTDLSSMTLVDPGVKSLSSMTLVDPGVKSDKQKQQEEKKRKQKEKEEQRERDRIARETKARLAAGRIGTI